MEWIDSATGRQGRVSRPAPWRRWVWKTGLFFLVAVFVLNPNLERMVQQVGHWRSPEDLIELNFAGLVEAQRELDFWAARFPRLKETELIERYVQQRIRYVTDYNNWWNMEYWPRASEVWERKAEDCDGRAIFAVSLLRWRGYASAKLAAGLSHMWVEVDENERSGGMPCKRVALLHPEPGLQLEVPARPGLAYYWELAKGLARPTALAGTGSALLAEVPGLRKAVLIMLWLWLCYHPGRDRLLFLAVGLVGMTAAVVFNAAGKGDGLMPVTGLILLAAAVAGAVVGRRASSVVAAASPCPRPVTSHEVFADSQKS